MISFKNKDLINCWDLKDCNISYNKKFQDNLEAVVYRSSKIHFLFLKKDNQNIEVVICDDSEEVEELFTQQIIYFVASHSILICSKKNLFQFFGIKNMEELNQYEKEHFDLPKSIDDYGSKISFFKKGDRLAIVCSDYVSVSTNESEINRLYEELVNLLKEGKQLF